MLLIRVDPRASLCARLGWQAPGAWNEDGGPKDRDVLWSSSSLSDIRLSLSTIASDVRKDRVTEIRRGKTNDFSERV